ncbi:Protein FAR1-RELATED SEQUENCE 12 [Acorus calamus]|uniref:Protein FAR1-RELATED SEQUENCE 12 n=1 Tax=Acorus calamus TaxID=4465 RepID=A0AAV9E815_ACOCL|nr:Protein FAR1-RELATED SEQUENCE 12 [Acorus calamus]
MDNYGVVYTDTNNVYTYLNLSGQSVDQMEMNDLEHIGESVEAEPQAAVNRNKEAEDIRHYEVNEELIIGMEFNSIDEAFSQYKAFAFRCGFGIMRSGRRFTSDGNLKAVIFACSKEGKLRKKKDESSTMTSVSQTRYKPTCKANCKAKMQIRTFGDGKWVLDLLVLEHNHEVDPRLSQFHRCHRALTAHAMKQLAINDAAGLPPCKTFEGGGYDNLSYTEKDCRNYLERGANPTRTKNKKQNIAWHGEQPEHGPSLNRQAQEPNHEFRPIGQRRDRAPLPAKRVGLTGPDVSE